MLFKFVPMREQRTPKKIFSNRAITLWNSLRERTVQATSIDAFKQKLRADLLELA